MQVHTLPKLIGISLLLAAFLNSACALHRPTGQSQFNPAEAPPEAVQLSRAATSSARARISPEDAVTRAVNTLLPTPEGYTLHHPHYTATFRADGVTFQPKRGKVRWQWHLITVETAAGPLTGVKAGEVRPEHQAPHTVVYRRGVLDEQYVARKGSIEQQFVIPQPLALQGADLQIRGQVQSGGVLESRDEHWVWRGEDKGIWLGQVRVYDAQGTMLPARLEVSQGETTIVIEGQGLAQAVYPVVVDPEIGVNDFRISDMGPDGDFLFYAHNPAVAYNGTNNEYLVVWWGTDNTGKLVKGEREIFGQRIDGATGAELGANDFRISNMGLNGDTSSSAESPAVVYNSTNNEYLVVWEGLDAELENGVAIYGQRLAGATGAAVGVHDFRLSNFGPDGDPHFSAFSPAVAYNSTNNEYLVVWTRIYFDDLFTEQAAGVFGQRLAGATGAQVGVNDFPIGPVEALWYNSVDPIPAVTYNSTNNEYLVVWFRNDNLDTPTDEKGIYGQRLAGPSGAEVGVDDFSISDMAEEWQFTAVAYNSTNNEYLVVWLSSDGNSSMEVYGQRLAGPSGAKVGVSDFPVSDMGPNGFADRPAVAYNHANNEYLVVWGGFLTGAGVESYGQRLAGPSGAKIGISDFRLSDMGPDGDWHFDARGSVAAYNSINNEYLVVWAGDDNTGALVDEEFEIYGQRWSSCGDGVVNEGEECEPGDDISFGGVDSCTPMCTINLCGNGVIDDFEDCDLGPSNGLPGSSCTFSCQFTYKINLERLHDLVASCAICPPQVKASLLDILAHAQLQLSKGNERQTLKTLKQFTKKVQHFLSKKRLPEAEGQQLQLQAEVIIAQLQEQLAGR